jgi:hypothetical protein
MALIGCSFDTKEEAQTEFVSSDGARLLLSDTVSPNEEYIGSVIDTVYYNVEVFQRSDNLIIVNADSNSDLFDKTQYTLKCDRVLTEADIEAEWLTESGGTTPTKDDRWATVQVSVLEDGEVVSQRNISYTQNSIETVIDSINQN